MCGCGDGFQLRALGAASGCPWEDTKQESLVELTMPAVRFHRVAFKGLDSTLPRSCFRQDLPHFIHSILAFIL